MTKTEKAAISTDPGLIRKCVRRKRNGTEVGRWFYLDWNHLTITSGRLVNDRPKFKDTDREDFADSAEMNSRVNEIIDLPDDADDDEDQNDGDRFGQYLGIYDDEAEYMECSPLTD